MEVESLAQSSFHVQQMLFALGGQDQPDPARCLGGDQADVDVAGAICQNLADFLYLVLRDHDLEAVGGVDAWRVHRSFPA